MTVLVVEDNPSNMRLTCDLLNAHGFHPLKAFSATEALEIVAQKIPDLILIDISLHGMDGLSLIKLLKNNPALKTVPIIVLTAHATKKTEEEAWNAGCDGFIVKPINTRLFPDQLRKYLSKS
ncbi:FOG: CheY-like receiver [Moorella thermoacetica Y72]|uniref:Stage 0 sporulation protein A homolog n=1 Tax=Moorella thermoacetica Y72 TaxID=1325331 RepID=A0A0S6UAU4_NEOTH|nr:response regulator [Moorella thermoacetica]GAF26074.1 FOG: CheY-like receiver [Moorella thermoacetica Y72]